jgi:hypothetical protein
MKLFYLLILIVSIQTSKPKISGYVYDKINGEKLCGVKVTTNADTTYTDFNGYFEINDTLSTEINFELISYEKETLNTDIKTLVIRSK